MYIRATVKSKMLMRATDVHVFLPFHDGYPDTEAPFKTLYFLPGYSANAEEIATSLPMRQMSAKYGSAIVIPDGENSFYSDHPERATLHGRFVEEELVETTRKLFPKLSHKREDTFIGGISMGGYGAARYAMKYPEYFSAALLLSPAVWENATGTGSVSGWHIFVDENNQFSQEAWAANHPLVYKDSYIEANSPVNFYIVHGDKDTTVLPAAVSAFYEQLNEFAPATYVNYAGGTHAWATWAATARMALEYAGSLLLTAAE